jgi:hypothetical protein
MMGEEQHSDATGATKLKSGRAISSDWHQRR